MANLEDDLKGKYVHVEVHLHCGAGSDDSRDNETSIVRTMCYKGTYHGTSFIGAQEMLVLMDVIHKGRSDRWPQELTSEKAYIALNDIVSIEVMKSRG